MTAVLFVHGTGVRKESYHDTFIRASSNLGKVTGIAVKPCYWGHLGSKLPVPPGSIPEYDTTRAAGETSVDIDDDEYRIALWAVLYDDPLYELRMLALRPATGGELAPGQLPPGIVLLKSAREFPVPASLLALLEKGGIAGSFPAARELVNESDACRTALLSAPSGLTDHRRALARAYIAQAAADASTGDVPPAVVHDATLRDQLESEIVQILGGDERGPANWVRAQLGGMICRIGTRRFANRRGAITDAAYPVAGDILLYQARGEGIRAFIREQIEASSGCIVLAHSLGGIACVDLLASHDLPVHCLITAGSQVPFLYEINALQSLPYGQELPAHFPRWLNIYDLRDFLSYQGDRVFRGRVKDFRVDNREPFPESHSAYWSNPEVWKIVLEECDERTHR